MKKIIILILSAFFIVNKINADDLTEIAGFRTTMANMNPIIDSSIQTAENLFKQNKGANLSTNVIVLKNNTHDLIDTVIILRNYKIIVSFKQKFIPKLNSFMPSYLEGKRIVFAPIMAQVFDDQASQTISSTQDVSSNQDFQKINITSNNITSKQKTIISGFNCATNIDENITIIMGQNVSIEKERSILAHLTKENDSKYYGNCIYFKNNSLVNFINNR